MAFLFPVLLISLFGEVYGHMGISDLNVVGGAGSGIEPREKPVVGDNYRFPNAGHCHGVAPVAAQKIIAVGDTVKLKLSGGAAHDGGHCALFLAKKSDNEAVWYKQMDVIDCTKMADFDWLVVAELVPAECSTVEGCGLIWVWAPKSSGACEIYTNCWNLQITGDNGGDTPAGAYTVPKNPVCVRVDGAQKTPSFAKFCGTTCDNGQGVVSTPPPTASPTTAMAPTASGGTSSPTVTPAGCDKCRCGTSWSDANAGCKSTCSAATESADCGTDKCWADMTRVCANSPTSMSGAKPAISSCAAVGVWSGNPSIDVWCAENCGDGQACPSSHCICSSGTLNLRDASVKVYQPVCQEYVVQSTTTTMTTIALLYDLSSYQVDQNGADVKAATELLNYNQGCNPDLASATTSTNLPKGITVFVTGDCQLTDKCGAMTPSGATKGFAFSSTMSTLIGMLFIASL